MKKSLLLFVTFLFSYTLTLSAQTITGSITHEGIERKYRLFLPSDYNDYESIPLVFNLHGYESNGAQQELYTAMNAVADTAKFFVCYAEGHKFNGADQAWNVGWTIGSTKDDVGFLSKLIDSLSLDYNINLDAVFSTGMSNGGFMSYKLACELNDRIKAIASVTGSMVDSEAQNCSPAASIPVMQIHGTLDPIVGYNGTPFISIPIEELVSNWVGLNECEMTPDTISVPNIDPNDGTTSERIEYNDCDGDSRVVFYKVTGGGHTWPGALINIGIATSQDFEASVEIWRFFRQYTTPLILSNKEILKTSEVEITPNPFTNFINIKSESGYINSFRVHNAIGKLVRFQTDLNQNIVQLSTSDFEKGIYFISVETDSGISVVKTIKH